jgi:acetyltransferase
MDKHALDRLFNPQAIALLCDTEHVDTWLKPFHDGLIASGFAGSMQVSIIGAKQPTIDTNVAPVLTVVDSALEAVDLAIAKFDAKTSQAVFERLEQMRCRALVMLGQAMDQRSAQKIHHEAHARGIKLLGPNSLGMQRPSLGLNASMLGAMAHPGSIAFVAQSGSLASAVLDWAQQGRLGFSLVACLGSYPGVTLEAILDFLANDPKTKSVVVHLEGIQSARAFMSSLRALASTKPVIVLKAGRQPDAMRAAQTHCRAMVGRDEIFEVALRRAGAVRVHSMTELFSAAQCLANRPRARGSRLAVLTNGGGVGVLAADRIASCKLELGRLSDQQAKALMEKLDPQADLSALLDLGEQAGAEHYQAALEAISQQQSIDAVLIIFTPKQGIDPRAIASAVIEHAKQAHKLLFCCWMGEQSVSDARADFVKAGLPSFRSPEVAVDAFRSMVTYESNQQLLQQIPPPLTALAKPDLEGARLLIESVLAERRSSLTEFESKALLAAFHIPITHTVLARSANEAMLIATQVGYPVAMKIDSPDILHKSDVQGVALNLASATSVRDMFEQMTDRVRAVKPDAVINGVTIQKMHAGDHHREVYIGLMSDPLFGPVLSFGAGGEMIELIDDHSLELAPLNQFLAQQMLKRSRIYTQLQNWRGAKPVNLESLEHILLRVSELACALAQVVELDINPILVDQHGAIAVDARVVLSHAAIHSSPHEHLAVLPYPNRYERVWPLRDGGDYRVRPLHPEDAAKLQALVNGVSAESRYFRFASAMRELPQRLLARLSLIDYEREMALIALVNKSSQPGDEQEQAIAVSRYVTNPDAKSCEFALLVHDDYAGRGLGTRMMQAIIEVARDRGLEHMHGLVLVNNTPMLRLMRSLGFTVSSMQDDPDFKLVSYRLGSS